MCNQEIRAIMKEQRIFMWQIAQVLHLHETTVIKYFRVEMPDDRKVKILSAIEQIRQDRLSKVGD